MAKTPKVPEVFDYSEDAGKGLEGVTIAERNFWEVDADGTLDPWLIALECIDKTGDKTQLIDLLKSDSDLRRGARLYLADLLQRYELKNKKGRRTTPAYDRTAVESRLEFASSEIRDRTMNGMPFKNALEEVAKLRGIPIETLEAHYSGHRGSSRRMNKRRR